MRYNERVVQIFQGETNMQNYEANMRQIHASARMLNAIMMNAISPRKEIYPESIRIVCTNTLMTGVNHLPKK